MSGQLSPCAGLGGVLDRNDSQRRSNSRSRESKSFARLKGDIDRLVLAGKPVSDKMKKNIERLTAQTHFWVPVDTDDVDVVDAGRPTGIPIPTLPGERPYDLGRNANWELFMGPGFGCCSLGMPCAQCAAEAHDSALAHESHSRGEDETGGKTMFRSRKA